jgi:hypothetical protein
MILATFFKEDQFSTIKPVNVYTTWVEPYAKWAITLITTDTDPVNTSQILRLHDEFRSVHTAHVNVDQALKCIILEACNNMYTSQMEYYLLQYANRSAYDILAHLKTTYGFINPTQLAENYNNMTAPINFQDPIETLFKQIEDGIRYTNAGIQPYMEAQYITISFLLILNTGAVPEARREWQYRTPVNKTSGGFRR